MLTLPCSAAFVWAVSERDDQDELSSGWLQVLDSECALLHFPPISPCSWPLSLPSYLKLFSISPHCPADFGEVSLLTEHFISRQVYCWEVNHVTSQMVLVVKNSIANAGDMRDAGSISGSGRCPGGGSDNPLTYSRLGNPMDRGVRWVQSMGSQRVGHDWATNTRRKGDDLDCVFCRSVHTWRDVKVKSPSPAQSWSSIQREVHTH